MEAWLDFGRGPLFRLCFTLMVLGLLRTFIMSIVGMVEAYNRAGDKTVPWKMMITKTIGWMIPVNRLWRARPVYSTLSFLWHIGLILVPLFLAAHVMLWKKSVGFAWPALPQTWADYLTLLAIFGAIGLFIGRVGSKWARTLSRPQDYIWPILLAVPFVSGYLCSNVALSAGAYQVWMLIHVYSANLVMLAIPFTKVAHCVLFPLSQFVSGFGWKFPKYAGDRVAKTLGKGEMPV